MITNHKAKALCMFAHSRLTGLYVEDLSSSEKKEINNRVIEKDQLAIDTTTKVNQIRVAMEESNYTVERLNKIAPSYYASMLTFYYNQAINILKKHTSEDNRVIDALIGLSIIAYLNNDKNIVYIDEVDLNELISNYEKTDDKEQLKIVRKMQYIASDILNTIEKTNYAKTVKKKRTSKKRR